MEDDFNNKIFPLTIVDAQTLNATVQVPTAVYDEYPGRSQYFKFEYPFVVYAESYRNTTVNNTLTLNFPGLFPSHSLTHTHTLMNCPRSDSPGFFLFP